MEILSSALDLLWMSLRKKSGYEVMLEIKKKESQSNVSGVLFSFGQGSDGTRNIWYFQLHFGKKTCKKSTESKINEFGSRFAEKSSSE